MELLETKPIWQGTFKELLSTLEENRFTDEKTKTSKDWPKSPCGLSAQLERLAPNLRRQGIKVTKPPRGKKGQIVILENTGSTSSSLSTSSAGDVMSGLSGNEVSPLLAKPSPGPSPRKTHVGMGGDEGDEGDDLFRGNSNDDEETEWIA